MKMWSLSSLVTRSTWYPLLYSAIRKYHGWNITVLTKTLAWARWQKSLAIKMWQKTSKICLWHWAMRFHYTCQNGKNHFACLHRYIVNLLIFLSSYHQMACIELKKSWVSYVNTHWDAAYRFLYCCGKYGHIHMSAVFKKAMAIPIKKTNELKSQGMNRIYMGALVSIIFLKK